jgi:uncharacterized phage infection (PIP) family protein YhgE
MELNQIKQQLSQVDLIINRAVQALKDDKAAPQELKDYVQQLGTQTRQAQQKLKQPQSDAALAQYIDDLEITGGRALQVCENARNLSPQAKTAVHQVYEQVSDLKQQLH